MVHQNAFDAATLDLETLPQDVLDIDNRVRTNPFPWVGQFSPQLVEQFLSVYSRQGEVVLDPFVGCGTTLAEVARLGVSAVGTELNPAATILARVYCLANLDRTERQSALEEVETRLFHVIGCPNQIFDIGSNGPLRDHNEYEGALVELWNETALEPQGTRRLQRPVSSQKPWLSCATFTERAWTPGGSVKLGRAWYKSSIVCLKRIGR